MLETPPVQTMPYFMIELHARELCFWLEQLMPESGMYTLPEDRSTPAALRVSVCNKAAGSVVDDQGVRELLGTLGLVFDNVTRLLPPGQPPAR